MRHHVDIRQLATGDGAYLNVMEGHGHIGVWGLAVAGIGSVHYFLRNQEGHFALVVFDTEAWAKEWLRDHEQTWPLAVRMDKVSP